MNSEVGGSSELVGIVTAFIILLITFGSLIAAGMPIVSALIGLGSSVGIIALLKLRKLPESIKIAHGKK